MGFFEKKKQEIMDNASGVIVSVFKRDIVKLLGDDAREQDVEIITRYFDDGHAVKAAKDALIKAGIL